MSERESKSKNIVRTTIGGVNERAPVLQMHEHDSLFGTFPQVAGLQQRIPGKRLHAKYDDPVWGIYQFWTPYGYGGEFFKLGDNIFVGEWTIPDVDLIPKIPARPHKWIEFKCPDGTPYIDFAYNGDSQGLFYAIATQNHTAAWKNPQTAKYITFTSSSSVIGSLSSLVDQDSSEVAIRYKAGYHWFKVDMGKGAPTAIYKLSVRAGSAALTFKLQGSNDDSDWDSVTNVLTIPANTWHTLTISETVGALTTIGSIPYRYWRLYCPVANQQFKVSEWEIYGHSICFYPVPLIPGEDPVTPDTPSGDPAKTPGGGGGPDPAPIEVHKGFELVSQKWKNSASVNVIYNDLYALSTPAPVPLGGEAPMPDPFAGLQYPLVGVDFTASAQQYSGESVGPYTVGLGFHFIQFQDAYGYNDGVILDMSQINLPKLIKFELEAIYEGTGIPTLTSRVNITPSFSSIIRGSDVLEYIGLNVGPNYTNGYDAFNRVTITGFVLTYRP